MHTPSLDMWQFATLLVEDLGDTLGPFKPIVSGWIRSRALAKIASCSSLLDVSAAKIADKDVLKSLLQVEALFKKNSAFTNSKEARAAAVANFWRAEKLCRISNKRLEWYYVHRDRLDPELNSYLDRMEVTIRDIFGSFHDFLEELPTLWRVTDGATAAKPRKDTSPTRKMSVWQDVSPKAAPILNLLMKYLGVKRPRLRITRANRISFVPKNWKTDRTIACEPNGNMLLQSAVDQWLKGRLKRFGCDLTDQSRNQFLSWLASVTELYATVDLAMASDTCCYNLVAWLVPEEWFTFLDAIRSQEGTNDELGTFRYAKFSSMGNGATFVLETAIFLAAVLAVGSKRNEVYGDDIIIESSLVPKLQKLLGFLGFGLNTDKTHVKGWYYESCGTHWFAGHHITPYYQRTNGDLLTERCLQVNGLVEQVVPYGKAWERLLEFSLESKLLVVPQNGDPCSGVWASISDVKKLGNYRRGFKEGANYSDWIPSYRCYIKKGEQRRSSKLGAWFLNLYQRFKESSSFNHDIRKRDLIASVEGRFLGDGAELAEFLRLIRNSEPTRNTSDRENTGKFRFRTKWRPYVPLMVESEGPSQMHCAFGYDLRCKAQV